MYVSPVNVDHITEECMCNVVSYCCLQLYNAGQLNKWCLHFISSNYIAFSTRPEWSQLSTEDLQYIEEHRWPPLDYINEVEEYEARLEEFKNSKKTKSSKRSCIVM